MIAESDRRLKFRGINQCVNIVIYFFCFTILIQNGNGLKVLFDIMNKTIFVFCFCNQCFIVFGDILFTLEKQLEIRVFTASLYNVIIDDNNRNV